MPYTNKFPDVSANDWHAASVMWASQEGIITGYTHNGKFGPSDHITREQMAVMMYRYAKRKGYDLNKKADLSAYPDSAHVSDFAREAMQWCVGNGIVTGDNGRLNPRGNASRVVGATIISRFIECFEK